MPESKNFHMSPGEFRRCGRAVVGWIADYYETIETFPVLSQVKPGQISDQLPDMPPETGEAFDRILKDVDDIILPGVTHWQSPNFFAYFPANASGPAILGELLSAGLGVQGMLWSTSPACTELETRVLDWLVDMLALPEGFKSTAKGGGVIQDSASGAALCAVLAARERVTGHGVNVKGCREPLVAYVSTQTHSSVEKAVKIAGVGSDNLHLIPVDADFALRPEALAEQIKIDRKAGCTPFFVCGTVGTTSSNAMDPLPEIGRICREEGLWFHVDAAMSGTAALCPEYRHIHAGLELADSYCFNPHKWMFTNFDCDCFFVKDRETLVRTLSILPEYLRNTASDLGEVIDYRDWHVPLGRRFRSLKLWFVLRHYGVEGLQHHVRKHVQLAQDFAGWVDAAKEFECVAPAPLNLVCFRHTSGDAFNKELVERLNRSGKLFLTHTTLNDQYVLRMCIGQTHTDERHVKRAWHLIQDTAEKIEQDGLVP